MANQTPSNPVARELVKSQPSGNAQAAAALIAATRRNGPFVNVPVRPEPLSAAAAARRKAGA
jgi:hypothetical protein